ncbi:MAG: putative molybdenum cofactor guanylyltransferase [candidate division WS2 bacterium]|nr:putative molybdenum cofactor guanylyltransferase [Candidatus Psychracetigena formicireducens]
MIYRDVAAGVVLAGGKSKRMGFPKELLTINGKRVISRILDVLKSFFEEILIVTNDKELFREFKEIKIVEDLVKGYGPLGGIYTGLKTITKQWGFFLAVDMPFLHNGLIKRILSLIEAEDSTFVGATTLKGSHCNVSEKESVDCIVPCLNGGLEPLHALYSKTLLPKIEKTLKGKDFSVKHLFKNYGCKCKYVDVGKEEKNSFLNINTPSTSLPPLLKKGE